MPRIEYKPPARPKNRGILIVYRVLLVLALLLVLAILGGTLYALVFRPKAASVGNALPSPPTATTPSAASEANIFTGLGRLRCPTAGGSIAGAPPGMVILQAAFPYYPGDRAFSEELVSRIRELRNISAAYFAALTLEELGRKSEADIKAELLARYNGVLRLGRIETLYFNEYMVIE
jgi:flagellar basal body-associated protein FliL